MTSIQRIKGANGVIIDSNAYLELPKATTKTTTDATRNGMIRYNTAWKAFEGVIDFDDGSVAYRRFAQLDANGRLLTSQLPDSITSGLKYSGTFDPIEDDIDPPFTLSALPDPSAANSGQYYIVRGIMDDAATHLAANPTSSAFVIFTPPNSAGQWVEIKYYIGKDPSTGTNTVVINAFARFITESIPSTGHTGLMALANGNADLTAEFTNTNNPSTETGLSDSDWVILTDTTAQRLRQSRVSIVAASVAYDNTVIQSVKRQFVDNNSTAQGAIDNLAIYGLRRTGDSMTSDGTAGAGRLGVTYGSVTAPAIAFNDSSSDPDLNSGMVPSEWTDTTTGIYRPDTGTIGFSASGVERLRISPTQLVLTPVTSSTAAVPNILFSATGNTNLGMNVKTNTIDFVSNSSVNVSLAQGASTFNGNVLITGNLQVNGNTAIGDSTSDTLTVQASSTFSNTSNVFLGLQMANSAVMTFQGANAATITKAATALNVNMTSFDDFNVMDGTTTRAKINRYGIQLPVLNPIDNAVGVDGMVAYSTERATVMQKTGGQWVVVGSGGGVATSFAVSDWVLSGSNYTYTITNSNILSVSVQELSGSTYSPVQVDNLTISATNAVLTVPASPDLRFAGRVIVQYQ